MPCKPCANGKWRFEGNACIFSSEESCKKALAAYHAKRDKKKSEEEVDKETK